MGVKGLLREFRPLSHPVHLKSISGSLVGVDASAWLHRAAYSCAMELALERPTTRYLDFFQHMLKMLLFHKIIPIVVFDGKYPSLKSDTAGIRRENREKHKKEGMKFLETQDTAKAMECFQRAIHISPDMVSKTCNLLDQMGIEFIRAPFEADAQLAYLFHQGTISYAISEDSDLLVFGVTKLICKLDRDGSAILVNTSSKELRETTTNFSKSEVKFCKGMLQLSKEQFIYTCVLAGCDYLDSPPGIGLKTAFKLVQKHKTLKRTLAAVLSNPKHKPANSAEYEKKFNHAVQMFLHQIVMDPKSKRFLHLRPMETVIEGLIAPDLDIEEDNTSLEVDSTGVNTWSQAKSDACQSTDPFADEFLTPQKHEDKTRQCDTVESSECETIPQKINTLDLGSQECKDDLDQLICLARADESPFRKENPLKRSRGKSPGKSPNSQPNGNQASIFSFFAKKRAE